MKVKELAQISDFGAITLPEGDRDIEGVYIGDLLSWVMGRARADDAWITIMSNVNVIAVASLSDVSCVIFAEGVMPEDSIVETATKKGINLISTSLSAYGTAVRLSEILK
ncbi:MAG: hypothetical protein IJD51_01005 [Clostridia bacterium]|nr:hypothetical protein [Clostridia bacterium]